MTRKETTSAMTDDCGGCPERAREALRRKGYRLRAGIWRHPETQDLIDDDELETDHAQIFAARPWLWKQAAGVIAEDVKKRARELLT